MKILIATADDSLAGLLHARFARAQMETVTSHGGVDLKQQLQATPPDIVIMDFELSEPDALALCRELRSDAATAHVPVIILTSEAHVADRIAALEAGADDCLSKPPHPDEILARIHALRRRAWPSIQGGRLQAGGIDMDLERWTVTVDGQQVKLTKKEFRLLQMLLEAKGRALSREFMLEHAWPRSTVHGLDTRTIDVHIGRLRRKLGPAGQRIITVRDVGFRFEIVPDWI